MRLATAVSRSKMRGVLCRRCNKTVPLTASFAERENTFKTEEPDARQELLSRVFPLRCKSCGAETIYTLDEVNDLVERY